MGTRTRILAALLPALIAATLAGCSLGDSDESDPPVLERIGEQADVRDDLRAIIRGQSPATLEDTRKVLLDGQALAQFGDRLLGVQVGGVSRDMSDQRRSAYRSQYGVPPEAMARALGSLLGRLESELDAALADASDKSRLTTVAWALGVAEGFADRYFSAQPGLVGGERIARLAAPRGEGASAAPDRELIAKLAPLLDRDPEAEGSDLYGAAESILDEFPESGGSDVIDALAHEISERIPARYLSAFLTGYNSVTSSTETS